MAEQDIIVRIKAEGADAFIREVKKAGVEVEQVGDKAEKTGDRLSSSFKKVGAAVAAAFATAQIGQFIKESVRLADIQLKAEAQLLKALKGRQDVQQRLLKQAQEIQKTTIFGDEEIIRQQSFLAQLQFTEKQINEIINASVNLSAGLDISLDSAVRNVAKTFSGLSGELGELVPQLRGLTQEQLKSGEAVELLTGLFEGQAATLRATGTGGIQSLNNAVGDLREELGKAILDGMIPLANQLQEISESQAAIDFFRALGQILGETVVVISEIIGGISSLFDWIKRNGAAINQLTGATAEYNEEAYEQLRIFFETGEARANELRAIEQKTQLQKDELASIEEGLRLKRGEWEQMQRLKAAYDATSISIQDFTNNQKDAGDESEREAIKYEKLGAVLETLATQKLRQLQDELRKTVSLADEFNQALIGDNVLQISEVTKAYLDSIETQRKARRFQIQQEKDAEALREDRLQKTQDAIAAISTAEQGAFNVFAQLQARELQILENRFNQGLISQKEYDQKRKELQQRQAKADKAQAIFNLTVSLAEAIGRAFTRGPLIGQVLAGISAAAITAQIAAVASTPIPQFAKGTKGKKKAPAGFKWVGEEGPELLYDKGGYNIMTAKDSDQIAKLLGSYGIPTQFKGKTTINEIDRPLKSLSKLKGTPLEKMDWGPLLNASDRQRMSLGRKLDKIHTAIIKGQSFNRPMTRA